MLVLITHSLKRVVNIPHQAQSDMILAEDDSQTCVLNEKGTEGQVGWHYIMYQTVPRSFKKNK